MKRKLTVFFTIILFTILLPISLSKAEENKQEGNQNQVQLLNDAKTGILMEFHTGKVLYEHNAHEKRSPASMTKIMSMLLITEAIDQGKIKWDDIITVSEHAAGYGGSQIYLAHNEQMSVEDLYKGMVIASGNDATVALAETVAGSEEMFVQMMNERAKELGLTNTHFLDPTGLTDFSEGHYSTAYDIAALSHYLLLNYGDIVLKYSSIYEDYLRKGTDREFWLVNTNKLVRHVEGVDGLKTGWTRESGYNLAATMLKDDMRLISVVMGNTTPTSRSSDTMRLLNYGYSVYSVEEYKPEGTVVDHYESIYLSPQHIEVVTKEPIHFVKRKGEGLDGLEEKYNYFIERKDYQVGDVIGQLEIYQNGELVAEVDLTVNQDVQKVGFLELFLRTVLKTLIGN